MTLSWDALVRAAETGGYRLLNRGNGHFVLIDRRGVAVIFRTLPAIGKFLHRYVEK
ncbi:MAG: hypothetical protein U1E46_03015 [Hyphomicrobiales bacterium]